MAASTGLTAQGSRIVGLMALADVLVGVVLAVLGVRQDNQTLAIVGAALLVSGGGMLAWVMVQRDKPQSL